MIACQIHKYVIEVLACLEFQFNPKGFCLFLAWFAFLVVDVAVVVVVVVVVVHVLVVAVAVIVFVLFV